MTVHQYADLISIFNHCFREQYNTMLVKGGDEPIYLPADQSHTSNRLIFAHGFFSSALHECSHWLIAGTERRQQIDFGYWYSPDGRTAEEQQQFLSVEIKPQAMEWILSQAAHHPFRVSLDNLLGEPTETALFKQAVYNQVKDYCITGLSSRAAQFRNALCAFYNTSAALTLDHFDITKVR
jgi:elongation factor P hydroxylase